LWVAPGKGYLYPVYDDENDRTVWRVEHQDRSVCEEQLEKVRIQQQKARDHRQALNSLISLAVKPENYVQGQHNPSGRKLMLSSPTSSLYGGGYWVIIEPGEKYFWFVQGHTMDGDDWSRNNVPGGIGYRLPYTTEAKAILEKLVEQ